MRLRSGSVLSGVIAVVAVLLPHVMNGEVSMQDEAHSCAVEDRARIEQMISAALPDARQKPKIWSCDSGDTPFASFSHISAELTPDSVRDLTDFMPVGDPGWIPMSLLSDSYKPAFEAADWDKVTYAESFDERTEARVFVMNTPDDRSFVLITSE
ncbi:MAG: hypothetical protein Q4G24_16155 [Paracoccus sp. (in: a-proteobacteria)]|uniref:hypothetical protein n=1 Tax=Paracoccus sp. TaxID=267 RepID=UPI0026DF81BC|nr:hypothetical protein [Paracoccus sp. (in: a-proteobacteria)]MDO5622980.1 hypothetical protein [Paracoccus sp. (in: a-proteobacteria)]